MDERLEKALEFSNYSITMSNQIRNLQEQFDEDIMCYINGGQFSATQERITFCSLMSDRGIVSLTLLDDNKTPILISNLSEFLDQLCDTYFSATNTFQTEHDTLKKNRNIQGMLSL